MGTKKKMKMKMKKQVCVVLVWGNVGIKGMVVDAMLKLTSRGVNVSYLAIVIGREEGAHGDMSRVVVLGRLEDASEEGGEFAC